MEGLPTCAGFAPLTENGKLSDGESCKEIGATSGLVLLAGDGNLNAGDLRVNIGAAFELERLLCDFCADIGAA